jgi:UPF0716 protein FxsA
MTRLLPVIMLSGLAVELASIIIVGSLLGVLTTLVLMFASGALGVSLIRSAGTNVALDLRSPIQTSSLHRIAAGKAVVRVIAGIFFLIPGFFSDIIGVLLLLPPVRNWLRSRIEVGSFYPRHSTAKNHETVIEAEATEIMGEVQKPDLTLQKGDGVGR